MSTAALALLGVEAPRQVVVLGAVTGLGYGLLGAGITLAHRTSRVLNFAHGQTGTLAASLVPLLVFSHGVPVVAAVIATVLAGAVVGALVERFVFHPLARSSRLLVLVATLGLAQLLLVVEGLVPRNDLAGRTYPTLLSASIEVVGVRLSGGALQILIAAPLLVVALELFLRRTRLGLATRASAENDEVARLAGVPVRRVAVAAWAIAGGLAAVAAILSGPTRPIITTVAAGPTLMVRGLAAALLAGFGPLPRVLAAGAAIGVLEALVVWNAPTGGLLELAMLALVLATIALRRDLRQSVRGAEELTFSLGASIASLPERVARHPRVVAARRVGVVGALAVGAAVPLALDNADRFVFTAALLVGLAGLSLVVLIGMAGQVSLGQYAFVAIGAVVGGRLQSLGYPWLTALLYATLAGAAVAVLVGLPALRIRGVYLAVTTLSFAVASGTWLFRQSWLTDAPDGGSALGGRRPVLWGVDFGSELAYCWLCLGALAVAAALVARLRRTGLGRTFVAVRDNEASAAALTINPSVAKLTAFALSGALASVAGYLYGGLLGDFSVHPETVFAPELSLALVGVVIFGGVSSVEGVIAAALWFRILERTLSPLLSSSLDTRLYGLLTASALLGAVLRFPGGLAGATARWRNAFASWLAGPPVDEPPASSLASPARELPRTGATPPSDAVPLRAEGIVVRYGGVTALDGVDLEVARGSIVALVGPNGAGKTTLFDVLTGRLRPVAGRVLLDGVDVTDLAPYQRARLGLGRTFQQARLFGDLTLREVIAVAQEGQERSELVPSLLGLPPSRAAERRKRARSVELLGLFGLGSFADHKVAELSTGTRRLAELAAQVAMAAPVVLLDEPTAGVAQREVEAFGPVLRRLRSELDATLVVIDHDVPLLRTIADRVVVLAAGEVVADCEPDALEDDPIVVAAFLGTSAGAVARSGPMIAMSPRAAADA